MYCFDNLIDKEKIFEAQISRSGLPCLTEHGGSFGIGGNSQIICDKCGEAKRAIHVFRRGDLRCGTHAVIPVQAGDRIICSKKYQKRCEILVYRIKGIFETKIFTFLEIYYLIPEKREYSGLYADAINVAIAKACAFNCRTPYYIKQVM